MFKFLFKRVPEPKVGMRLEHPTWGKEWSEIEIVKVSKNKKEIMYKYITARGHKMLLNKGLFSATWSWIVPNAYTLIKQEIKC